MFQSSTVRTEGAWKFLNLPLLWISSKGCLLWRRHLSCSDSHSCTCMPCCRLLPLHAGFSASVGLTRRAAGPRPFPELRFCIQICCPSCLLAKSSAFWATIAEKPAVCCHSHQGLSNCSPHLPSMIHFWKTCCIWMESLCAQRWFLTWVGNWHAVFQISQKSRPDF